MKAKSSYVSQVVQLGADQDINAGKNAYKAAALGEDTPYEEIADMLRKEPTAETYAKLVKRYGLSFQGNGYKNQAKFKSLTKLVKQLCGKEALKKKKKVELNVVTLSKKRRTVSEEVKQELIRQEQARLDAINANQAVEPEVMVKENMVETPVLPVKEVERQTKETVELSVAQQLIRIRNLCADSERVIGEQSALKEGFVYLVVNAVFEGWYKVGMTLDYEARLTTYNTSCPFDGYKFIALEHVSDRRQTENMLLVEFANHSSSSKGEWFKMEEGKAKALFTSLVSPTGNDL